MRTLNAITLEIEEVQIFLDESSKDHTSLVTSFMQNQSQVAIFIAKCDWAGLDRLQKEAASISTSLCDVTKRRADLAFQIRSLHVELLAVENAAVPLPIATGFIPIQGPPPLHPHTLSYCYT